MKTREEMEWEDSQEFEREKEILQRVWATEDARKLRAQHGPTFSAMSKAVDYPLDALGILFGCERLPNERDEEYHKRIHEYVLAPWDDGQLP